MGHAIGMPQLKQVTYSRDLAKSIDFESHYLIE